MLGYLYQTRTKVLPKFHRIVGSSNEHSLSKVLCQQEGLVYTTQLRSGVHHFGLHPSILCLYNHELLGGQLIARDKPYNTRQHPQTHPNVDYDKTGAVTKPVSLQHVVRR